MSLDEFLLACYDDDEAYWSADRISIPPAMESGGEWKTVPGRPRPGSNRGLADVAAKRRIVERWQLGEDDPEDYHPVPDEVLRILAMPYAGYPGYKPEWAV